LSSPSTVTPPSDFKVAQEDDAVASRKVSAILMTAIVVMIAAVAIAGWILSSTMSRLPTHPQASAPVASSQIAGIHQTPIERDRHGWTLHDQQRRSLDEYRWVNREREIAQIPIDRAMQMIVDEEAKGGNAP